MVINQKDTKTILYRSLTTLVSIGEVLFSGVLYPRVLLCLCRKAKPEWT